MPIILPKYLSNSLVHRKGSLARLNINHVLVEHDVLCVADFGRGGGTLDHEFVDIRGVEIDIVDWSEEILLLCSS